MGYISCFNLNKEGHIVSRMFMIPTNTTGTTTSSLTVAPWSNEHVLYGDAPSGSITVLKLDTCGDGSKTGDLTANVVAKLDIAPGSCCSNALWLD